MVSRGGSVIHRITKNRESGFGWNTASAAICVLVALGVILSCGTLLAADKVGENAIAMEPLSFGSRKILENCWTEEQRLGSPEDRYPAKGVRSPSDQGRRTPTTMLPHLKEEWRKSIRRVAPYEQQKLVALTFDLCETGGRPTGYDASVVNMLRKHGASATFFACGRWMQTHPDKAKQLMADPLFEIGNHTWTHADCRTLEEDRIRDQILRTQAQYEMLREDLHKMAVQLGPTEMEKIPRVPSLFRFPYGTCGPTALRITAESGLAPIQWDVVMGDPVPGQSVSLIVDRVLRGVRPGSIVVGHANGRNHGTAEALETILPRLESRGFRFVTVSELLRRGKVIATEDCYQ